MGILPFEPKFRQQSIILSNTNQPKLLDSFFPFPQLDETYLSDIIPLSIFPQLADTFWLRLHSFHPFQFLLDLHTTNNQDFLKQHLKHPTKFRRFFRSLGRELLPSLYTHRRYLYNRIESLEKQRVSN